MRRLLLASLAAALAVGCHSRQSSPLPSTPRSSAIDEKVESSAALNGLSMAETRDGPWIVRGAAGPEGGPGEVAAASGAPVPAAPSMAAPEDKAPAAKLGRAGLARKEAPVAAAEPAPLRPASAAPLKAGATDDNAEFEAFLKFLTSWSDRRDTAGQADLIDVRDRRYVRVVDGQGRPIPTAQVRITDEAQDKAIFAATTYGDGRVPFYPHAAATSAGAAKYVVEASFKGERARASWNGASDLSVTVKCIEPVSSPVQLDVLFALDTTGSMQDEIDRIKATLLAVTGKLKGLGQEFDLRYGAVLYRDLGDEYVTRAYPFSSDIQAFARALESVNAGGGGDEPESVNQALAEAVRASWRPGAAKVMFLIGDAPPHMDYQGDVPYGKSLKAALEKGIRIHSIAASGLNPFGTLVWRQVAQFTRGKFIFIEYGSAAATAESHGVTGAYNSNNLDDILFEQIRDELAYWGKDAPAPSIANK